MSNRSLLMKSLVWVVLIVAAGVLFGGGAATLQLSRPVSVNGTAMAPGEYRLTWTTDGTETAVTFTRGGKVAATTRGRIVSREQKFDRNMVVFGAAANGASTIAEIRLANQKDVIVFE